MRLPIHINGTYNFNIGSGCYNLVIVDVFHIVCPGLLLARGGARGMDGWRRDGMSEVFRND